jgi:hypothetical protein
MTAPPPKRHTSARKQELVAGLVLAGLVALLVALLVIIGGHFLSGDEAAKPSTEAVRVEQQTAAREKAAQRRQVARLRAYLRDNFSETTWYPAIERIELAPFLTVHTTLYREYEPAQAICNAVRFSGVFPGVPVRVFNRDGDRIMWTGDPGDQQPCDDD